MDTTITKYYSPIQFQKIADIFINPYVVQTPPAKLFDNNVILTRNELILFVWQDHKALQYIIQHLHLITVPFVIISAMEDYSFPYEININYVKLITQNSFFKHWFTVNCTLEKYDPTYITPIPYGLDYWTLQNKPYFGLPSASDFEQDTILDQVASNTQHFSKRIPMIYANFHLNPTDARHGGYRQKLKNIIPRDIIYYQNTALDRTQVWENITKYAFVLSPPGNGLDCIRTFEALVLGCIVILHKNTLNTDMYTDLPVYIVDNYSSITKDLLENILVDFSNRTFNYEKLTNAYWIQSVYNKLR